MRHVWTLIAASAVALAGASASAADPGGAATADAPRAGTVTGVSVLPAEKAGRADVVVAVDSTVDVQDFVLEYAPYRIVVDFTGAKLGIAPRFYDHVARGPIVNVRYAQFKPGVVRVVLELDGAHKYIMTRAGGEVRLSIEGVTSPFTAWRSGSASLTEVAAAAPTVITPQTPTPVAHPVASKDVTATVVTPGQTPTILSKSSPVVTSAGGLVVPAARTKVSSKGLAQNGQQSTQPRITVTYQDAEIRDVLAAFAAFSGRTIVVGREVQGTVTAEIRDQPWDVALQSILSAQQLAASEDQYGIITVDSYANIQAKQASEPLVTQMVSINYAHASTLVATVKSLLGRDCKVSSGSAGGGASTDCSVRGNVVADSATNSLLITESQSHMTDVINYVRDLDVKTPQVSIRAKIIFVNRTALTELGLAYDVGSDANGTFFNKLVQRNEPGSAPGEVPTQYDPSTNVVNIGGDGLAAIGNASRPFASSAALSLLYSVSLGGFNLTSFLDALTESDLTDVQAEPSIVTLDNRPAKIQVGEEVPIRVVDASATSASTARATVSFKEVGVILQVTPHITNNGQILMILHAEQSSIQSSSSSDLGYYFLKRYSDNQLLVGDGETAVIGGLTQTTVTKSKTGLPILSDLPLIGGLFSQTSNEEDKQDLLILVTPHILADNEVIHPPAPIR
jgi:type IV pilus assembly protein PilQ